METVIVERAPGAAAPTGGLGSILGDLAKLERYWALVSEVIMLVDGTAALAVGATEPVPPIKFSVGAKRFTWDEKGLTRTA